MDRASAPRLDLFKLLVSLILVAILLLLLLRGCGVKAPAPGNTETPVKPNPTETLMASPALTETATAPLSTETLNPSPTPPPATATAREAASTPTPTSSDVTPTVVLEETPTLVATEIAATPTVGVTPVSGGEGSSCNTSVPSRLQVGQRARVILRLNMRSEPAIDAAILQVNPANTQVEVIGGPVCTPAGERAYLWWQIRLADGAEGWSAESQLNQPSYFLEPVP